MPIGIDIYAGDIRYMNPDIEPEVDSSVINCWKGQYGYRIDMPDTSLVFDDDDELQKFIAGLQGLMDETIEIDESIHYAFAVGTVN